MDRDRELLRHCLAAVAYRTQKALRDAPPHYPDFDPGHQVRTPVEILRHMTSLMGYTRTLFVGGSYPFRPDPLPTLDAEVARFHEMLGAVAALLEDEPSPAGISTEQLLQGPFADVMTHVGQLALLRRLADAPVPPENFIFADVRPDRLGPDQPRPARPDAHWPERPRDLSRAGSGILMAGPGPEAPGARRPVDTGPLPPMTRDVTIVIRYQAQPGHADRTRAELDALIAEVVRREPACHGIRLLRDPEAPDRFLLLEQWGSREAYFGEHMRTPHIRAFIERAPAFLAGPPEITSWDPVSAYGLPDA